MRRKKLAQDEKRLDELDRLFLRLYEDNVVGRISDERYAMMSGAYEEEQATLKAVTETLRQEIQAQEQRIVNLDQFHSAGRQVRRVKRIDPLRPPRTGQGHLH